LDVSFEPLENQAIMRLISDRIACSTGSACETDSVEIDPAGLPHHRIPLFAVVPYVERVWPTVRPIRHRQRLPVNEFIVGIPSAQERVYFEGVIERENTVVDAQ
jgi:hypothetical protein